MSPAAVAAQGLSFDEELVKAGVGLATPIVSGTALVFITKAAVPMPSMSSTLNLTAQNAETLARGFRSTSAEPATVPSLAAAVLLGAALTLAALALGADRR